MKRRTIIAGGGAVGAAMAAGLYRFTDIFVKHYPPTPYDDVLAVTDREQASRLGAAALRAMPDFDVAQAAARLRAAQAAEGLSAAAVADAANGRVIEADGWLVPQSVALIAALAAKFQA
jgi:2-polyprenyl-6-methoxyphenol hydroxylase-like FAD-dependent oxidoreductase